MAWSESRPLLARQFVRLGRLGWRFWLGVVVAWIAVSWSLRVWALDSLFLGGFGFAAELLLSPLIFVLRIDVALAILLQIQLWPRDEWERMAPQLRLTALTSRSLLVARTIPTLAVLFLLNTLSAPYFYSDVAFMRFGEERWAEMLVGALSALGAWFEDLTFAAVCVLCAARHLAATEVPVTTALSRSLIGIAVRGLLIAVVASSHELVAAGFLVLSSSFGYSLNQTALFLAISLAPVAFVLALEVWLIFRLWRATAREFEERWGSEAFG
ncbi:hypothetical protein GC173_01745 [bacterium]|nr:hypothetical protein [bacterium]